jgi:transposase-like protein
VLLTFCLCLIADFRCQACNQTLADKTATIKDHFDTKKHAAAVTSFKKVKTVNDTLVEAVTQYREVIRWLRRAWLRVPHVAVLNVLVSLPS